FESPFGMELLATVDWLLTKEGVAPKVSAVREGLRHWHGDPAAAMRKNRMFDDRAVGIALERLAPGAAVSA
ncbi:MAG TPA: Appr-1-p processing protein, partial [Herbaspirillum sp.]|nr:Appr-1-p processing protein [Herbaspirillum sp.]